MFLTKFKPKVPDNFKNASIVLLGNLDPNLQGDVLSQTNNAKISHNGHYEFLD